MNLTQTITHYVNINPLDQQTICKNADVDPATLSKILCDKNQHPQFATIQKLANELGIPDKVIMAVDETV